MRFYSTAGKWDRKKLWEEEIMSSTAYSAQVLISLDVRFERCYLGKNT